jgi:hypothetical protein
MNVVGAALIKLAWRPAAVRTLLILGGLVLMIFVMMGAAVIQSADPTMRAQFESSLVFPGALGTLSGILVIFAGLAAAAFGSMAAGSEWSWNTYRVAVARGESRVGYVVGLFVAIALLALAALVALYALGTAAIVVVGLVGGLSSGNPLDTAILGQQLAVVVAMWWAVTMQVGIAFSISFLARSTVAGVAAVVGLMFLEMLAVTFVPMDLMQWAPMATASSLVKVASQAGFDASLATPLAVTTAYLAIALIAAAFVARRSDIA